MKIKVMCLSVIILGLAACSSSSQTDSGPTTVPQNFFSEPIGTAERGEATFEINCEAAFITPLGESDNLIEARVGADRNVTWRANAGARTEVFLIHGGGGCSDNPRWDIQLSPSLPLSIDFDAASGSLDADMSGLDLRDFTLEVNNGFADLTLPAAEALINVRMDINSGNVDLDMADNASVRLDRINVNSGRLDIAVSRDSEVRLELLKVNNGDIRIEVPEQALVKATNIEVSSGTFLLDSAINLDIEATVYVYSGDFFLNVPDGTSVQIIVPEYFSGTVQVPFDYEEGEAEDEMQTFTSSNFPSEFSVILHFTEGSGRLFVNRDE